MITLLTVLSLCFQHPAPDTSFARAWSFAASSTLPMTTLNGTMDIVFDSATYVVGGLKVNGKTLLFHGRHLGRRLALRTDKGFNPVLRVDCTLDSLGESFSGIVQSSKVHAVDKNKQEKDFYDVIFQFYAVKP